jgi:hypothetical protein
LNDDAGLTERHLHALLSVEADGWELIVLDLLQRDLVVHDKLDDSQGGVGRHLDRTEPTAGEALLAEDGRPVERRIVAYESAGCVGVMQERKAKR